MTKNKFLLIFMFLVTTYNNTFASQSSFPYENIIWEGRFQPFHNGHLSYIKKLKEHGRNLWIVVLSNETSDEIIGGAQNSPVPEFTKEVDPHHRIEKNPLPQWLRFMIVKKSVEDAFGLQSNIYITMGHRLDLDWNFYKKNLPAQRVFITPLRDSYEDSKAIAWNKLGEKCIRIDVSDLPDISATKVRESIKKGESIEDLVPLGAIEILKTENYWEIFIKSIKNG